jgi:hypothetical protein
MSRISKAHVLTSADSIHSPIVGKPSVHSPARARVPFVQFAKSLGPSESSLLLFFFFLEYIILFRIHREVVYISIA